MCTTIGTLIGQAKRALIKKANKTGIYENFGQDAVRKLYHENDRCHTQYSIEWNKNNTLINAFDEWCMDFQIR